MNYAVQIENDIVTQVAILGPDQECPVGWVQSDTKVGIGYSHADGKFQAPPAIVDPKVIRRVGEFREFLDLFAPEELVTIKTAERDDVQIAIWFDQSRGGPSFSLDHPDVAPGLDDLVSKGLLTEERAAEINGADFDAEESDQ